MKVIYNPKLNKEKNQIYKVECDCGAELEVEEDDIKVGTYGMGYIMCPCCQNEYYDELWADMLILNKENLKYPIHYTTFENSLDVENEDIDEMVADCIEKLEKNPEDFVNFHMCGNTAIFVFRFEDDNEYDVYVCKNYQETFIPIIK